MSLTQSQNQCSFVLRFSSLSSHLQRWRRKREGVVIDECLQSPTVTVTENRQLSSLKVVLPHPVNLRLPFYFIFTVYPYLSHLYTYFIVVRFPHLNSTYKRAETCLFHCSVPSAENNRAEYRADAQIILIRGMSQLEWIGNVRNLWISLFSVFFYHSILLM